MYTSNLDSSLAPCEFLYKYLDDEARELLAVKISELPSEKKIRVVDGIKKPIKNPNYWTEVYKFLLRLDVQLFK